MCTPKSMQELTRSSSRYSDSGTTSPSLAQQKSRGRICKHIDNQLPAQYMTAWWVHRRARRPIQKLKHEARITGEQHDARKPLSGTAGSTDGNNAHIMYVKGRYRAVRWPAPKMACDCPETVVFCPILKLLAEHYAQPPSGIAQRGSVGWCASSGGPYAVQAARATWLA